MEKMVVFLGAGPASISNTGQRLRIVIETDSQRASRAAEIRGTHVFVGVPSLPFLVNILQDNFFLFNSLELIIDDEIFNSDPERYQQAFSRVMDGIHEVKRSIGNSIADQLIGIGNTVANAQSVQDSHDITDYRDLYPGVPAFVVCSGPSLDHTIPILKNIQNTGIVIACDSSASACYDAGISPDFVVTLERMHILSRYYEDARLSSSKMLCLPVIHPQCLKNHGGRRVFYRHDSALCRYLFSRDINPPDFTGSSCSILGLQSAIYMGCRSIYLFGADHAYHPRTGGTHFESIRIKTDNNFSDDPDSIQIMGGAGGLIWSKKTWALYRQQIDFIAEIVKGCHIYSVMPDGYGAAYRFVKRVPTVRRTNIVDIAALKAKALVPAGDRTEYNIGKKLDSLRRSMVYLIATCNRQNLLSWFSFNGLDDEYMVLRELISPIIKSELTIINALGEGWEKNARLDYLVGIAKKYAKKLIEVVNGHRQ